MSNENILLECSISFLNDFLFHSRIVYTVHDKLIMTKNFILTVEMSLVLTSFQYFVQIHSLSIFLQSIKTHCLDTVFFDKKKRKENIINFVMAWWQSKVTLVM